MEKKKKKDKKFKKFKERATVVLDWISEEDKGIKKQTSRVKANGITYRFISKNELQDLYLIRKDRKYAGLIVELCSLVEQFLHQTYSLFYDEKIKKEEGKSIIQSLENSLKPHVELNRGKMKLLNLLRNEIIHSNFSLKKAKKSEDLKAKLSSEEKKFLEKPRKELFSELFDTAKNYLDSCKLIKK